MKTMLLMLFVLMLIVVPLQSFAEEVSSKYHVGTIQWLQATYPSSGPAVIQVIDPDMNMNPEKIDNFDIFVWSDSNTKGYSPTATETGASTGVFEATLFFSLTDESSGPRLKVVEGDTVTAEYEDRTLPASYTEDSLSIIAKSEIHPTFESPLKQVKYTHPANIVCNENLVLRFKYDLKPVCMNMSSITDIQKRNPDYFSLFDMAEYQTIGGWIKKSGPYKYVEEPSAFYSYEQPRPAVGTVLWQDDKTSHKIKYLMINGTDLNMISVGLLQDPSDRHNWPIEITFTGNENTILILELPDELDLKNAVGMHMEQFEEQNILFPFVVTESTTNRQVIISDIPDEKGIVFVELAFLRDEDPYDISKVPLPTGEKYMSENSVDLGNIPEISCEINGGIYEHNRCFLR